MIVVSNCENELAKDGYLQDVGVIPFDVEAHTKMPAIPTLIAEKLTELQSSKAASVVDEKKESFVEKLGLEPNQREGFWAESMKSKKKKEKNLGASSNKL